jgi:hypothetical protein
VYARGVADLGGPGGPAPRARVPVRREAEQRRRRDLRVHRQHPLLRDRHPAEGLPRVPAEPRGALPVGARPARRGERPPGATQGRSADRPARGASCGAWPPLGLPRTLLPHMRRLLRPRAAPLAVSAFRPTATFSSRPPGLDPSRTFESGPSRSGLGAKRPYTVASRARRLRAIADDQDRLEVPGSGPHHGWCGCADLRHRRELRPALLDFRDTYNATWLVERHGFRPPEAIRKNSFNRRPWPPRVQHGVPHPRAVHKAAEETNPCRDAPGRGGHR